MSTSQPPGWYPDESTGQLRWWDGQKWGVDSLKAVREQGPTTAKSFAGHRNRQVESQVSGWGAFAIVAGIMIALAAVIFIIAG